MSVTTTELSVLSINTQKSPDAYKVFLKIKLIIKAISNESKVTNVTVAKILSISKQSINQYINNNTLPYEEIYKFSQALKVPMNWILGDDENYTSIFQYINNELYENII